MAERNSPEFNVDLLIDWQESRPTLQRYKRQRNRDQLRTFFTTKIQKQNDDNDVVALVLLGCRRFGLSAPGRYFLVKGEVEIYLPKNHPIQLSEWKRTNPTVRYAYATAAACCAGHALPFTLRITKEMQPHVTGCERELAPSGAALSQKSRLPATFMSERINREFRKLGIPKPEYWFVVEDDKYGQPHLHGVVHLHGLKLPELRNALRRAGGASQEWVERADSKQEHFYTHHMLDTGKRKGRETSKVSQDLEYSSDWIAWSSYCLKAENLKGRTHISPALKRQAQALYNEFKVILDSGVCLNDPCRDQG